MKNTNLKKLATLGVLAGCSYACRKNSFPARSLP